MKRGSTQALKIVVAIDILLLAVVVFALYFLISKHRNALSLEIEHSQETAKLAGIESLNLLIKETEEQRTKLSSFFVDDESIVDFIEFIEDIGDYGGAGLRVITVNYGEEQSTDMAAIRFEATGSWPQITRTIALVDYIPMAMHVSSLQIVRENFSAIFTQAGDKTQKPQSPIWRAAFEVQVLKTPDTVVKDAESEAIEKSSPI